MAIILDIQKVEIPVQFGEVELSFNPSEENILKLQKALGAENGEFTELRKRLDAVQTIEDDASAEHLQDMIDLAKEVATKMLDSILGEGAFEKIYAVYPSLETVINGFIQLALQLPDEVEGYKQKISDEQAKKIAKYKRVRK